MGKRPMCRIVLVLMIGILLADILGISWIWRSPGGCLPEEKALEQAAGKAVGKVYRQEEKEFDHKIVTYLYLKNTHLIIQSKKYPIRNIKCTLQGRQRNLSGCTICAAGELSLPPLPGNPGEFNRRQYERGRKIDFYLKNATVERVAVEAGRISSFLDRLRKKSREILKQIFPEKDAGVLQAMLTGEKQEVDLEVKEAYQAAGISHVLAISGLHITMAGMAVWKCMLLLGLPLPAASVTAFFLLWCYGIFIGIPTTSFRALVMFGIMAGGKIIGRAYDLVTGLAVAAILLLTDNPDLLWDTGFQLSFTAVAGLALCSAMKIRSQAGTGGFLWLFSLPVVLHGFCQVSLAGLLCNLLVIPLMPFVLGSGMAALVAGTFHILAGSILAIPASLILRLYEWIGKVVEKIPFGVWTPGKMELSVCVAYYCVLALVCVAHIRWKDKNAAGKRAVWMAGVLVLLGLGTGFWKSGAQVLMLDVGQGDGILVRTGKGGLLVDGGSVSRKGVGRSVILPVLKHEGITRLEGIFITHTDQDHYNGALEVLEESGKGWLDTEWLFMPVWMEKTQVGQELEKAAEKNQVRCRYIKTGDRIGDGEVAITMLHPGYEDFSQKPNDGSLVFTCEGWNHRILFTGDLTSDQEEALLPELPTCDILKTGHHGSDGSSGESFLEAVNPSVSLISCGKDNRYGHPGRHTLERLKNAGSSVCRTDLSGALLVYLEKNGAGRVKGYRQREKLLAQWCR